MQTLPKMKQFGKKHLGMWIFHENKDGKSIPRNYVVEFMSKTNAKCYCQ